MDWSGALVRSYSIDAWDSKLRIETAVYTLHDETCQDKRAQTNARGSLRMMCLVKSASQMRVRAAGGQQDDTSNREPTQRGRSEVGDETTGRNVPSEADRLFQRNSLLAARCGIIKHAIG